jgi:hypothetical protein
MTISTSAYPGQYTLKTFYLTPDVGSSSSIDISLMIPSFSIIESINNDSIRGTATVVDTIGLLEKYPLRGEERITITIEDALGNNQSYYMFLYKIDNIRPSENSSAISYTIYFTSYQRWRAGTSSIIAAYNLTPSEIVKQIYNKYYIISSETTNINSINDLSKINKELLLEDLSEEIDITLPNVSPMYAMKFICDRSYSVTSPSCSFRFFETANNFCYMSDEYIYKNAIEKNKNILEFTNGYINRTPSSFNAQMNNLEKVNVSKQINTMSDLSNGAYKSVAYLMDINYGTYDEFEYDYLERKDKYYTNSSKIVDKHNDKFITNYFNANNAKKFYIMQSYDDSNYGSIAGNQHYPEIVTDRTGFRRQLESLTLSASGPGRLDITCGDIISLNMKQSTVTTKTSDQLNGKYIVNSIVKTFEKETMTNNYTLIKRGWE